MTTGMTAEQIIVLPLWYAVFLLSITCHEAAHAWVAHRGGDDTAYHGGQVTLNPLPHVLREPVGTVVVPLLSFLWMNWMMGWASAPYDPLWERRHPRRAAAMAAAGPAANLLLALAAFLALRAGLLVTVWLPAAGPSFAIDRLVVPAGAAGGAVEALGRLCSLALFLNVLLFLFNLVPLPPLDGSGVAAGLWAPARDWRDRLRASGAGGLLGLVVAMYAMRWLLGPIFGGVLHLLYRGL